MNVSFRNLDATSSFRLLDGEVRPRLAEVLTADRVRSYECSYDLGSGESLAYNYATKLVSEPVLDRLAALAEEQQLIDKYRMILDGEVMNTGEGRMVLHHLCRGQLGRAV
ncbi:MAG: glucose-6-phosphate isomerase, partial [Spirochaetota bacterium]